jgi:cytochrome c553
MQVHFQEALAVHDAVTRGDLAAVRPPAAWLATHEPPAFMPAPTSAHVAAMQAAARQAADAETVLGAAMAAATMLKTCGDCHRAAGTMPAMARPPRPELGGLVGHMLEHQVAAEHLANGLIVPSSAEWRRGAEGFRKAPLRRSEIPPGARVPASLLASESRIHELADQALRTEDPAARAVFYGQILARCADCHSQHRTLWGPGPR